MLKRIYTLSPVRNSLHWHLWHYWRWSKWCPGGSRRWDSWGLWLRQLRWAHITIWACKFVYYFGFVVILLTFFTAVFSVLMPILLFSYTTSGALVNIDYWKHPSSCFSLTGGRGSWSLSWLSLGMKCSTPCTSCRFHWNIERQTTIHT